VQDTTHPKYKEQKKKGGGENAMIYLQANKMHTTSIRDHEEPPKNILAEETHLHATITSRKNIEIPFLYTFNFNNITF
jgi:hypothetical protein